MNEEKVCKDEFTISGEKLVPTVKNWYGREHPPHHHQEQGRKDPDRDPTGIRRGGRVIPSHPGRDRCHRRTCDRMHDRRGKNRGIGRPALSILRGSAASNSKEMLLVCKPQRASMLNYAVRRRFRCG